VPVHQGLGPDRFPAGHVVGDDGPEYSELPVVEHPHLLDMFWHSTHASASVPSNARCAETSGADVGWPSCPTPHPKPSPGARSPRASCSPPWIPSASTSASSSGHTRPCSS